MIQTSVQQIPVLVSSAAGIFRICTELRAGERAVASSNGRALGRPRVPLVSRKMIVTKALEVIDRDGFEALSLRRIGRELGVTVGALYHHITGKDDLLLEVTRALLRDLRIAEGNPISGRDALVEFARAYRGALVAHPNAAPLLVHRPWRSYAHPHIERLLEVLDGHGVESDVRLILFQSLEMLAFSSAIFSPIPDIEAYGEVGDQFPLLQEALNLRPWTADETFEIVVNALLAGFGIALASRPAGGVRTTNERR